ncbi:MAG: hypothetical protein ACFFCW_12115 [Candidatus Hodarchaeota archaeon]
MDNIILEDRLVGKTDRELTPDVALQIGVALGTYLGKNSTIITSRDFRTDCRMLKRALTAGLMAAGANTIDFHAAITPITQFAIKRFGASAGVAITSGLGPQDEITIRIFDSTGVEWSKEQLKQIFQIWNQKKVYRASPEEVGQLSYVPDASTIYQSALNRFINIDEIAKSRFRVVLDCALGPASIIAPSLFSKAGCDVVALNSYQPVHIAEVLPNTASLLKVSQTIIATNADVGIVFDVEGNRVVFLDSDGNFISPDEIATLFLKKKISRRKGIIAVNNSLSRSIEQIIKNEDGPRIERVAAAPGTIASCLRDAHGLFGASDQGEYMFPAFSLESDGILASLMMLELLANEKKALSELLSDIPRFPVVRYDLPCRKEETTLIIDMIRETAYEDVFFIDTLVGVKLVFPKRGWVHIRPSLKRDTLVLSAEAEKFSDTDTLLKKAEEYVRTILKELRSKPKNKKVYESCSQN